MAEIKQIVSKADVLLSYIISEGGDAILVDPPADIAAHLDDGLNIKAVINTHTHPDHTRGNRHFKGLVQAHQAEATWLMRLLNGAIDIAKGSCPTRIRYNLHDGDTLKLGETEIKVIHTPGHSPGGICLYWPGNLISGDTLFAGNIGATHFPGGSMEDMKTSLDKLFQLPDETTIWPGHYYSERYSCRMLENRRAVGMMLQKMED